METSETINFKFTRGLITQEQALIMLKERYPRTPFMYCVDAKQFYKKTLCLQSPPSGNWYYNRWSFCDVWRKDGSRIYVHSDDIQSISFYCRCSDKHYHSDDFTPIECDGEKVCLEHCRDKIELDNGVYYYKIIVNDDNVDDSGRSPYHSVKRLSSRHQGIGVELELECHSDIWNFCDKARSFGIFAEDDGSLDEETGVELIGPIAPFEDYVKWKHWGPMFDIFKEHDCIGHDADGDYGIHVSLSLSLFSDLDLSKFVLFFNTCSRLCKIVAQRDTIYSGSYGCQREHKRFKKTFTDKYEAVKVDAVRAEVRIFRSTIRKDRFLKNIEFCEAVRHAVKTMSAGTVLRQAEAEKAFLTFLTKERKTYPNLYNFLAENKLVVSKKVQNKNIKS